MGDTRWISCADTAKLIRKVLKARFPGIKFRVRSKTYSGGASINVGWMDGPTRDLVESHVKSFAGSGFDGMIDLAYSKTAYLLPDGSAAFASTIGTEGSRGVYPAEKAWMPEAGSERVHFGSDYVFCDRSFSEGITRRAVAAIHRKWGGFDLDNIVIKTHDNGVAWVDANTVRVENAGEYLTVLVHRELYRRTNYPAAA